MCYCRPQYLYVLHSLVLGHAGLGFNKTKHAHLLELINVTDLDGCRSGIRSTTYTVSWALISTWKRDLLSVHLTCWRISESFCLASSQSQQVGHSSLTFRYVGHYICSTCICIHPYLPASSLVELYCWHLFLLRVDFASGKLFLVSMMISQP